MEENKTKKSKLSTSKGKNTAKIKNPKDLSITSKDTQKNEKPLN